MSAFWMLAIGLTVAYIIYYAVIIIKDLTKPREQLSTSEETFVLEKAAPEPSKVVEMTDKGFQVDDGTGNVREQEITNVPEPQKPDTEDDGPGPKLDANGAPVTPMGKKVVAAQEVMELIDPKGATEESLGDLKAMMTDELPSVNIDRKVTPPEKGSGDEDVKKEPNHDAGQRI